MTPVLQTAEDLLRFREPGKTAELVRGVLIAREPHDLGEVIAQDTGFKIERDPDTVRAPDVAFQAASSEGSSHQSS